MWAVGETDESSEKNTVAQSVQGTIIPWEEATGSTVRHRARNWFELCALRHALAAILEIKLTHKLTEFNKLPCCSLTTAMVRAAQDKTEEL